MTRLIFSGKQLMAEFRMDYYDDGTFQYVALRSGRTHSGVWRCENSLLQLSYYGDEEANGKLTWIDAFDECQAAYQAYLNSLITGA